MIFKNTNDKVHNAYFAITLALIVAIFQTAKSEDDTSTTTEKNGVDDDDNVCLLYSSKKFSEKEEDDNSPILSLRPIIKVFDTNLLFHPNSSSPKGITIQSVNLTKANCSVILCDEKHLQGNCIQFTESTPDISSEDGVSGAVYKNVRSVDCHCSFIDPNDIFPLPAKPPPSSGKLMSDSKDERGYPRVVVQSLSSRSISSCATIFRDWHFKGQSLLLDFAGSVARVESDLGSRVRSIFVKNGCTATLWGGFQTFSISTKASFLQTNGSDTYEWACCYCDQCSQSVCENAEKQSNQVPSTKLVSTSNYDFSQFAKHSKKIIGIGRNYRWTKVELAKTLSIPKEPIVFLKPSTSFIQEGQLIQLPKSLGTIFYELELGVVIGKKGKDISEGQALDHVAGYFLALDMTAKEFIKRSGNQSLPWEVGKGFDTACPVGGFIPKSQLSDPNSVHLECRLNDEVTQSDSTSNMIFKVEHLISYVSRYMTLEPYDVILTGTPDGFGPMKEGDVIDGKMGNLTSIHFVAAIKK